MDKKRLLSIGEVSKITGVSVKSLRYYEKIGILNPIYVNPDSKYRYYDVNQMYFIEIIQMAIEMDIPLKELQKFISHDEIDFKSFSNFGRNFINRKMEIYQRILKLYDFFNEQWDLQEIYPMDIIYERNISEKCFHVVPYDKPFNNIDIYEILNIYLNNNQLPYDEYEHGLEYGLLCDYRGNKINRYIFSEVSKKKKGKNFMSIPAGKYICKKSYNMGIEKVTETFSEHLERANNFIAIETEIFSGKVNINNPINEVRIFTN